MCDPELEPPTFLESVFVTLKGLPGFVSVVPTVGPGWVSQWELTRYDARAGMLRSIFSALYELDVVRPEWLKKCSATKHNDNIVAKKLCQTFMLASVPMGNGWESIWSGDFHLNCLPNDFLAKHGDTWVTGPHRTFFNFSDPRGMHDWDAARYAVAMSGRAMSVNNMRNAMGLASVDIARSRSMAMAQFENMEQIARAQQRQVEQMRADSIYVQDLALDHQRREAQRRALHART